MMTLPFQRGKTYDRRIDIHRRYGGQQQGGIIMPRGAPLVILVTGKKGLNHGYVDTWLPDGLFEYVGEGRTGDMTMTRGNLAIGRHYEDGKELLLFTKLSGGTLRYEGDWICTGYRTERRPDSNRELRDAFVFELCPSDRFEDHVIEQGAAADRGELDPAALRERALSAAQPTAGPTRSTRTTFHRSREVRRYVLARAAGLCEGCSAPAPFRRADGTPYLEPHHTLRVSDGGPDHPLHVIGLCPTCHRRVHHGADGEAYNESLKVLMREIESA